MGIIWDCPLGGNLCHHGNNNKYIFNIVKGSLSLTGLHQHGYSNKQGKSCEMFAAWSGKNVSHVC